MRGVITAFIISAAIVGGSFIYTDKMNKISGELTDINNSVAEKINAEDYDAAMSDIERLRGAVTGGGQKYAPLVNRAAQPLYIAHGGVVVLRVYLFRDGIIYFGKLA